MSEIWEAADTKLKSAWHYYEVNKWTLFRRHIDVPNIVENLYTLGNPDLVEAWANIHAINKDMFDKAHATTVEQEQVQTVALVTKEEQPHSIDAKAEAEKHFIRVARLLSSLQDKRTPGAYRQNFLTYVDSARDKWPILWPPSQEELETEVPEGDYLFLEKADSMTRLFQSLSTHGWQPLLENSDRYHIEYTSHLIAPKRKDLRVESQRLGSTFRSISKGVERFRCDLDEYFRKVITIMLNSKDIMPHEKKEWEEMLEQLKAKVDGINSMELCLR